MDQHMRKHLVFFWIGFTGLGLAQVLSIDTGLDFGLLTQLAVGISLAVWIWDIRAEAGRAILKSIFNLKAKQEKTMQELAEVSSKSRLYTKDFISKLRAIYNEVIYKFYEIHTHFRVIVHHLRTLSYSKLIRYVAWRLIIIFWRIIKLFGKVIKDSSLSLIKYVFLEFIILVRLILVLIRAIRITLILMAGNLFFLSGVSLFLVFIDIRMQRWNTSYIVLIIYLVWLGLMRRIKSASSIAFGISIILILSLAIFRFADLLKLTEDLATWAYVFFTVGVLLMIIQELINPERHHERENGD